MQFCINIFITHYLFPYLGSSPAVDKFELIDHEINWRTSIEAPNRNYLLSHIMRVMDCMRGLYVKCCNEQDATIYQYRVTWLRRKQRHSISPAGQSLQTHIESYSRARIEPSLVNRSVVALPYKADQCLYTRQYLQWRNLKQP